MLLEDKIRLRKYGRELAETAYGEATRGLPDEALLAFCRNMAAICEGARTFTPQQAKTFERTKCVFQPFDSHTVGDMPVQQLAALADSANDIHAYLRSDLGKAKLAQSEFKSGKASVDGESDADEDAEAVEEPDEEEDDVDTEDDTDDA